MLQENRVKEIINEMLEELDEEWHNCYRHNDMRGRTNVMARICAIEELQERLEYEEENSRY